MQARAWRTQRSCFWILRSHTNIQKCVCCWISGRISTDHMCAAPMCTSRSAIGRNACRNHLRIRTAVDKDTFTWKHWRALGDPRWCGRPKHDERFQYSLYKELQEKYEWYDRVVEKPFKPNDGTWTSNLKKQHESSGRKRHCFNRGSL